MIPYIELPSLKIWGPLAIHPFGVLVALGLITGYHVARYLGEKNYSINREEFSNYATWVAVTGFIVAHIVSVVFYFPEKLAKDPLELVKFWTGLSSFGGFFGGAIASIIYLKKKKLPKWEYIDISAVGLSVGWLFGRLGCTIAHDHPGKHTNFFLAVRYPEGPRHDLGFYEWLFTIVLNIFLFSIIIPKRPKPGNIVAILAIIYSPVRFMLDFLRVADKLYFGLTPGQYFSIFLFGLGWYILYLVNKDKKGKESKTSYKKKRN